MAKHISAVIAATTMAGALAATTVGIALAHAAPTAVAAAPAPAPAAAAKRPNILFILIDDMGFADPSVTGNREVATPNMDMLAKQGLLMTQFYDAAPICSASRAGFMTGQFPAQYGFVTFLAGSKSNARTGQAPWLDLKMPTLARELKPLGYATGHFGKWHLGGGRDIGNAPLITQYGFDESYTQFEGLGPRAVPNDEEVGLAKQSIALGRGKVDSMPKSALTGQFVDKALDFISRHKNQPWFVDLWPDDVHADWVPNQQQLAATNGAGRTPKEKDFLAVLVAMDKQIGRVIDTLRQSGQLDNTLIVLTSDNGPTAAGNKKFQQDGITPGSAGIYRGRKASLYEGGIRQPMIVRWPGHVPAGARDTTTVGQGVDLLPTLAAVTGAPVPAKTDGVSLWQAWQGKPIAKRPNLYFTFGAFKPFNHSPNRPHDDSPTFAIRSGDWKLLCNDGGTDVELYDVAKDPTESRNVAAQQPAVAKQLTARLMAWRKPLQLKIATGKESDFDAASGPQG